MKDTGNSEECVGINILSKAFSFYMAHLWENSFSGINPGK